MADEGIDNSRLYRSTSTKRISTPLIITVVLLLAVLLGGGYVFFQSQQRSDEKAAITPTVTQTISPTDTPTPTEEVSPSPKTSVTPNKTSPTTKPTTSSSSIDREDITLTVLNGSGIAGAAGKIGNYLEGLGYSVASTGNADSFDYEDITINVKKGNTALLNQLKKDLAGQGTVADTSETFTGSSDAQVIIEK